MKTTQPWFALLGLVAWGDIANITIYKSDRGPLVAYAKTWPTKPPSPLQQLYRDAFANAVTAWLALTQSQRAAWSAAARKASLCATGHNLFLSCHILQDWSFADTISHQTGLSLYHP